MFLLKSENKLSEEFNVSATLRIVKLLVKYAVELKEELQSGLASTPTQPWKGIIPQLFCRLNHPEAYVRQSISELLSRIARDFPHLIIYPAVVGSQDGPTRIENVNKAKDKRLFEDEGGARSSAGKSNLDEPDEVNSAESTNSEENQEANRIEDDVDDEEDEEETVKEEKQSALKNSYKYLLDTLTEANPKMIDEVKLFVHEMRRITLLREELWFGTLNQIRKEI